MKNIRIWLAMLLVIMLGAIAIQTLRLKIEKVTNQAENFERSFREQDSINKGFMLEFNKITKLQEELNDQYTDSQLALSELKKTKYIVNTSSAAALIQAQVDAETIDTIRCNELVGGNPKLKSEKNSICPELVQ